MSRGGAEHREGGGRRRGLTRERVALPPGPRWSRPPPTKSRPTSPEFWAIAQLVGAEDLKTARVRLAAFAAAFPDTPRPRLIC